jgi:glycosyltransferase involved in cell wall biosynthesis
VRLLFVKYKLAWPRSSGHDVHTYNTMRACAALGHDVSLALAKPPQSEAIDGLNLRHLFLFDGTDAPLLDDRATWLQRKFRSFFGIPDAHLGALARAVRDSRAEAVVIAGLNVLPYFTALNGVPSVWYAADELAWHHLSQVRFGDPQLVTNLRETVVKALYERAHSRVISRVWVVTETERRAMRWLAGMPRVDVLPQGVDAEFYAPGSGPIDERTGVFWGRLDFGPNIQALEWFFRRVWPIVRARIADARFTIIGFNPGEAVRRIAKAPGVTLTPDVPDLRDAVRRHAVAVFPFVSGGGVKNKLLEAAAMGIPIVCTPLATNGLRLGGRSPLAVAAGPQAMADALVSLWSDPERRSRAAREGREWVLERQSWTATAREALGTLQPPNGRQAR